MFTNWKIKNLTLLGFSIPTILMIIFSIMVYANSNKTRETLKQVNIAQTAINGENLMTSSLLGMDRRMRRYVVNPQLYKDALELYAKSEQTFKQGLEQTENVINSKDQKERLEKMRKFYNEYTLLKEETVKLASDGKNRDLIIQFFNNARDIAEEFEIISDEFEKVEKEALQNSIASTKKSIDLLTFIAVTVSILSLSVVVVANFLITKFLETRIAKTVQAAEKISLGDLTQSVVEDVSSNQDEVGQLLKAFQNMTKKLSNLIRQVQQSGIQVTSSATQIAASGKQLETSITEQVASTNQVTMSQLSSNSVQTAASLREINQAITKLNQVAQGLRQEMNKFKVNDSVEPYINHSQQFMGEN
ncbi:HAMP domain-containing protein [Anabaena sp. UHCC 0451]|uniref:HAMP domain-containing protein n=1 Tax=Anabaena sp. UHCC 0451 TaxID=2055235 RepID=UPI002B21806D|nr:HAMP domain-containing protein [Anabaena sp. UHCC 0451]MEA5577155.1 HAMP domain-containing protein [Anabaena sp. UHCC 0451]